MKNKLTKKLFKVTLGEFIDDSECMNLRSIRLISEDALGAIKKARARKTEYIHDVEFISHIDKF